MARAARYLPLDPLGERTAITVALAAVAVEEAKHPLLTAGPRSQLLAQGGGQPSQDTVGGELWIMLVANMPINRPTNGLDVVLIKFSANPLPNPLKATPIRPTLTKKK